MIVQVKWKLVYENLAFSTNVSLYFVNSARYGHSYKLQRKTNESRMRWCHFELL